MSSEEKVLIQIEDAYPLSMLQAGMLFHSEYNPESAVYHDIFTYNLSGEYNLKLLREALDELVSNHPILRTAFNLSDFSEPLQMVYNRVDIPLAVEDLRDLPQLEKEAALCKWTEEEKKRPFNWGQPPLFRIQIHRFLDDSAQISISFHHSILDGWSVAVMMTELFTLYRNKLTNTPNTSSMPNLKYREFIALERQAIQSEECQNFWISQLEGSSFAKLPRWPLPKVSAGYINLEITVTEEISEGLKKLAKNLSVPIKAVLLAAHLRVMSLITGERDIVTGLVANGRPEKLGGERLLGLFLNTLPFRTRITGESWSQLIRETFAVEQEMLPYRRYPLAEIGRQLNKPMLFESVFNFISFHVYKQATGDETSVQGSEVATFEQTNFPLTTHFSLNMANQVQLSLNYDTSQFSSEQMTALGSYYLQALKSMIADPEESYTNCSLLPETERTKLMDWKGQKHSFGADRCIYQLFEEIADQNPGNLALICGDEQLTYGELNQQANQLAHYLQEQGVQPETLVCTYLERSIDFIISVLGVWKAGGAYLPLDPVYPLERIGFILEETQAPFIITNKALAKLLPKTNAEVISLDRQWKRIKKQPKNNLGITAEISNLAYVIYTSGSTGKPKGALMPHAGLANVIHVVKEFFAIKPNDRILQLASVAFDVSVGEIAIALGSGATLCLSEEKLLIGEELLEILKKYKITIGSFTPAPLSSIPITELPDLRIVFTSGDLLTKELVDLWMQGRRFFNFYGPTETTIWSTSYLCKTEANRPPIGKPFPNVEHYVLDENLQMVPIGVPGELYIGGVCLARGYIKRPELTAERFITHPFTTEPGAKLYKSGDLVRYLPDGNLEFLARIDNQVKIRGFRVELGEIENVLLQHPDIQDTTVIVREEQPGDKRLIAYLVLTEDKVFNQSELRNYLQEILPNYMIPSVFVLLTELPLTSNGKVDKKALPIPDGLRPDLHRQYISPRTPTELKLAEIWAGVLRLDKIGIHDDFFELGGHSLSALQVVTRIREEFQAEMPLRTLFSTPTIEGLALLLVQEKSHLSEDEDLEELLAEIENMSDDDAEKMI